MDKPLIKKLKNGFVVCIVPHKGVRTTTIHLRGRAGSNYEGPDEIGSAHLAEHLSVENPLKKEIIKSGGKVVAVTSRDEVLFMVKVLKKDLNKALRYILATFKISEFSENDLNTQKHISIQEINRFLNVPEKLISRISYKLLFPKDRMSKLNTGSETDLNVLSLEAVKKFKHRTYVPNNFCLTVSGDFNKAKVLKICSTEFGKLKYSDVPKLMLAKSDNLEIQNIHNGFFTQTHLKIDYYDVNLSYNKRILSIICAKAVENYLKSELKNKKGLAYSVLANSFNSLNYGVFSIYCASGHQSVEEVLLVASSLLRSVNEVITKENFGLSKNQLLAELEFSHDKTSSRADFYSQFVLAGMYKHTFEKELLTIRRTTLKSSREHLVKILSQKPKITIFTNKPASPLVNKYFS